MEANFEFFYDICVYANENWGGGFTEKEIAMNAFDYYNDYLISVEAMKPTISISILLNCICEDIRYDVDSGISDELRSYLSSVRDAIVDGIYH